MKETIEYECPKCKKVILSGTEKASLEMLVKITTCRDCGKKPIKVGILR